MGNISVGGIQITDDMDEWYDLSERDLIETIQELAELSTELCKALTQCRAWLNGMAAMSYDEAPEWSDTMVTYGKLVKNHNVEQQGKG